MDKEFFVREVERQGGAMYRAAYAILGNMEDCRDALQDAVLKAWEKRGTLRDEAMFRTWLTRILINTCYDALQKKRPVVSFDDIAEVSAPPPNPELYMALGALPAKLRLPLVLSCSEGMSYEEIARALRITVGTVRGRIHRAKQQLRKELEAQ